MFVMQKGNQMSITELNTVKVDLVRYILDEADASIIEKLLLLIKENEEKPNSLAKHRGRLKRGIDGLEYQKAVRNEWD